MCDSQKLLDWTVFLFWKADSFNVFCIVKSIAPVTIWTPKCYSVGGFFRFFFSRKEAVCGLKISWDVTLPLCLAHRWPVFRASARMHVWADTNWLLYRLLCRTLGLSEFVFWTLSRRIVEQKQKSSTTTSTTSFSRCFSTGKVCKRGEKCDQIWSRHLQREAKSEVSWDWKIFFGVTRCTLSLPKSISKETIQRRKDTWRCSRVYSQNILFYKEATHKQQQQQQHMGQVSMEDFLPERSTINMFMVVQGCSFNPNHHVFLKQNHKLVVPQPNQVILLAAHNRQSLLPKTNRTRNGKIENFSD